MFCWKLSSAKMKRLPYMALRLVFTYFDSSYALIERVNIPTLHISRKRLITIATFMILHKMPPVYLMDLLSYKKSMYSFRYDNIVDVPRVFTTKYGKSSFCYEAMVCGTASRMICAKSKILRISGGWSALRSNVQKLICFIFAFAMFFFSLLYTCSALLNFYFDFIFSLFCFCKILSFA